MYTKQTKSVKHARNNNQFDNELIKKQIYKHISVRQSPGQGHCGKLKSLCGHHESTTLILTQTFDLVSGKWRCDRVPLRARGLSNFESLTTSQFTPYLIRCCT